MKRIDNKYSIQTSVVKYDGTVIPEDEPLFLFRAQDKLLPEVLEHYKKLRIKNGATPETLKRMDEAVAEIKAWQKSHHTQLPL